MTVDTQPKSGQHLGTNQSGMRARNERLVLSLVRRFGSLSKSEIARSTGLSAQTVSVIMRALEADGLLIKGDPVRGRVGQPSVPMKLAPHGAYSLGLKVGRRSTELVLIDFLGQVQHRATRVHAFPTPEGTLAFAKAAIPDMCARLSVSERKKVTGLGIAMPFFIWNWAEKLGVPDEALADWRHVDIRAELETITGLSVFLENDASAACGAEVVFGIEDVPRDFLYFYVGYFVGGGVVLNGSLFTGAGNAGAIGPMPIITTSGPAQLLDVASLVRLQKRLHAAKTTPEDIWANAEHWSIDPAISSAWVEEAAQGLSQAILSACSIIDFGHVRVDGWMPRSLCAQLVDRIEAYLERVTPAGLARPEVAVAHVGSDARAIGAAALPLAAKFQINAAV